MFLRRFLQYFVVLIYLEQTKGIIGELSFRETITTVYVNEGASGYIRCGFEYRDKSKETPAWQRSGTTITLDTDIVEGAVKDKERFKIKSHSDTDVDEYSLFIEPVERSDGEYKYKCVVFDEDDNIILTSEPIELIIRQVPGMQYPAFEPLKEKYQTGSEIAIICFTERTHNSINTLKLYKDRHTVATEMENDDDVTYQKIKYTFTATPEDNAQSFRCHLYNNLLPLGRNKTTGLINIEFAPNVSIFEPEEVFENKEAIFICRCVSNPSQVTYSWEFSENVNEGDYKVEQGSEQILRIKKPNSVNNGSRVICKVTNDIGTGRSTAILRVLKPHQASTKPPPTTTPGEYVPLNEMTLAIIIAAAGGCSVLIILIIILPMYYRYLKNCLFQPNIDVTGTQIAQPDIYFEPKDSIRPPLPTPDHVEQWRISVGIQVSPESNEHSYTEVGGNSSKGSDQIYGGSINDAATATYRSKSVYV